MAKKSGHKPANSVSKKVTSKTAVEATTQPASQKKVSANLIATIEKRKQEKEKAAAKGGGFGRPAGRRGRRPKRPIEYTPQHNEDGEGGEETAEFEAQSDYTGLEYDTGIRVEKAGGDDGFRLDRFDDFDEELNFDR